MFIEIFENCPKKITFRGHITWGPGRYNYFNHFQEVLNEFANKEYGSLISFNLFFDLLRWHLPISRIFNKFNERINIDGFDLEILKVIFLLNLSDEIQSTSKNITTLMISNVKENPFELNKRIDNSLEMLVNENLIEKNENSNKFQQDYLMKIDFKQRNN